MCGGFVIAKAPYKNTTPESITRTLETPISQTGTISFLLHTDKTYSNGIGQQDFEQQFVTLNGLASVFLQRTDLSVNIFFAWNKGDRVARGFHIEFTDLPGPETYCIQFSWDADKGISNGFMNGIPLRFEGVCFAPWKVDGEATDYRISQGAIKVTDVNVHSGFTPPKELKKQVPESILGKGAHLLGQFDNYKSIDIKGRKGKILYASSFDSKASLNGWVLEGPGILEFGEGHTVMSSSKHHPETRQEGHFTFWCKKKFPESFVAEWEFKPIKENGLAIIFFAAAGANGEDIFDNSLPKRTGHYPQYTSQAINGYHIIYFSNLPLYQTGNIVTRMRKANMFHDIAFGPIGVKPGFKYFHLIQLIKDRAHIQLKVNGKVYLDFIDPGTERWGPILGAGNIGFRQMAVSKGAYRNFKVWALKY